jgi:hypothetical protein
MTAREPEERPVTSSVVQTGRRRWLLFVHQLPSHPSNLRVRTWRRLQQLGAIPVKQAVYVLPDTPNAREDFEWLKTEVKGTGGDAVVFAADAIDAWTDDALVEEFRRSRQDLYAELAREIEKTLKRADNRGRSRGTRAPALRRLVGIFRQRLTAIEGIDFFGSAGRDRIVTLLERLDGRTSDGRPTSTPSAAAGSEQASYDGRLWVTRPRPGVDRMASAWLIRRFIDENARFGFAADREAIPEDAVPFDMFGVQFTHQGDGCTFETLCSVFQIRDPAVSRIAAIVHDLDLKDARFGAPEAGTVGTMIEGLQLAHGDDGTLLGQGIMLFDSLYRSFDQQLRSAGPRPLARPNRPASGKRRTSARESRRRTE